MKIPFVDLTRQYQLLQEEIDAAVKQVFSSGCYVLGPQVKAFEREFADYLGVSYAVGVASGTEAITLALWSLGIGKGDAVVVPANSLPSVWGVIQAGARPVLVDIDPQTYNIDTEKLEELLSNGKMGNLSKSKRRRRQKDAIIKAILAVHLYGRPAPMGKIMRLADKFGVKVIEDCAQACGAEIKCKVQNAKCKIAVKNLKLEKFKDFKIDYQPHKVGSIGDIGIFSFYPTKNLGGYGDGGMVVTNSKKIADQVRILRMYGEKPRYQSQVIGINSRLDELQAAILRVKLPYLDKWNEKRKAIATTYLSCLSNYPIKLPNSANNKCFFHVFHLYVIRSHKRDQLKKFLAKKGVDTIVHYPLPIHLQPCLRYLGYKKGDFPQAEKACREVLSLPLYPEMRKEEVEYVCQAIKEFFDE